MMQFGLHLWVVLQFWGAPAPPAPPPPIPTPLLFTLIFDNNNNFFFKYLNESQFPAPGKVNIGEIPYQSPRYPLLGVVGLNINRHIIAWL